MTGTINSVGTHLSGVRELTDEEIKKWAEKLPYNPSAKMKDYKIATKSFVILFLPVIPIETFVFYYVNRGLMNSKYRIIFYPSGKGKVYWEHVKQNPIFFLVPLMWFFGIWILILLIRIVFNV